MTPYEEKLVKLAQKGGTDATLLLLDFLYELEDKIISLEEQIKKEPLEDIRVEKIALRLTAKLATLEKGNDGHTPTKEELIPIIESLIPDPIKGDDGKSYILTQEDKKEIAQKVKVPIVEKVVETIIKEQPIITNEVKEVITNTVSEEVKSEKIRDELETLKGDERLNKTAIKGLEEEFLKIRDMIEAVRQARVGGSRPLGGVLNVGVRIETPTGIIDGINTIFQIGNEPKYVVSDGITYFQNSGYVLSNKLLTMTNPPSQYIRSFF